MIGKPTIPNQSNDHALTRILNKIQSEIKRLGNIRGQNGIEVRSNGGGVFISPTETRNIALFELTSDLTRDVADEHEFTATAHFVEWSMVDGSPTVANSPKFAAVASDNDVTLFYPNAHRDGNGDAEIAPPLSTGDWVYALNNRGKWEIIWSATQLRVAKLSYGMGSGCQTTTAKICWYNNSAPVPSCINGLCYKWADTSDSVTITDPLGRCWNAGDMVVIAPAWSNKYAEDSSTLQSVAGWVIVEGIHKAEFIELVAMSNIVSNVLTGTINTSDIRFGGHLNGYLPTCSNVSIILRTPGVVSGCRVTALYSPCQDEYHELCRDVSPQQIKWAKAVADWENTTDPKVSCVEVADRLGGSVASAMSFNVYLPRSTSGDPAIFVSSILGYADAIGNIPVCVTSYMDDRISTVKLWSGATGDIPKGWALCDGENGTIDLVEKFVRGASVTTDGECMDIAAVSDLQVCLPNLLSATCCMSTFYSVGSTSIIEIDDCFSVTLFSEISCTTISAISTMSFCWYDVAYIERVK